MHLVKTCCDEPNIFANKFTYASRKHSTNFSKKNSALRKYLSYQPNYKVSIRRPSLWNKFMSNLLYLK